MTTIIIVLAIVALIVIALGIYLVWGVQEPKRTWICGSPHFDGETEEEVAVTADRSK